MVLFFPFTPTLPHVVLEIALGRELYCVLKPNVTEYFFYVISVGPMASKVAPIVD